MSCCGQGPFKDPTFKFEKLDLGTTGEAIKVGENDCYRFGVTLFNGQWTSFAVGDVSVHNSVFEGSDVRFGDAEKKQMIFFFPSSGSDDRDEEIRFAGAAASFCGYAYGAITRWSVPEHLRGTVEEFECANCGELRCDGDCVINDDFDIE